MPSMVKFSEPAWIERYLEHVRVERRLAARTVDLYAIHLKTLVGKAREAGLALDEVTGGTTA